MSPVRSFFSAKVCQIQSMQFLERSLGVKKNVLADSFLFFFLEPYFLARHVEILGILCRREGGASRKTYGESGAGASNHLLNHHEKKEKRTQQKTVGGGGLCCR